MSMSRKQRIIISIVGISIISLALIGLTYGYYLTKIQGNTNSKSISISTADLELVYSDNSAEILGKDLILMPSDTEIGTKTFTVTNKGNDTSYVVVIENTSVTNASDGTSTTFESNDFRYILTCTKKDGTSCDGVTTQSVFPIDGGILVGNNIAEGDVHTYTFKMWYIDTGIDQSNDMGKTLQARLNIKSDVRLENPFSNNKNSLAYNIIENSKNKTNGTELLLSPKSKVGNEISQYGTGKYITESIKTSDTCNGYSEWRVADSSDGAIYGSRVESYEEAVGKYVFDNCEMWTKYLVSYDSTTSTLNFKSEEKTDETTLSITPDDYGDSYYFRGNVIDNYVDFAGMCWKVVRIAGDGSVKLILEDQDSNCTTSDGNWDIPTEPGGTTKTGNFGYTEYAKNTLTATDGTQNEYNVIMTDYLNGQTESEKSMATAFKNFQGDETKIEGTLAQKIYKNHNQKSISDYLKVGNWCLNDKAYASDSDNSIPLTSVEIQNKLIKIENFYYDTYVRLIGKNQKEPTLKCRGTVMDKFGDNSTPMYVSTLTADEIIYAGISTVQPINKNFFLLNNYQKSNELAYWTLSPFSNDREVDNSVFFTTFLGVLASDTSTNDYSFSLRPAINLKNDIEIKGGDGTKENAYQIS